MRATYPVSLACEVLEVSASGYFNWLRRRHSSRGGPPGRHSDEAVLAHIRAIHVEVKGEYGWPRMHKELLARGIRVGKEPGASADEATRYTCQNQTQIRGYHRQPPQPAGGARPGAAALQP